MDNYDVNGKMSELLINLIQKNLPHKIIKSISNPNNNGRTYFFKLPLTLSFEKKLKKNKHFTVDAVDGYFHVSSVDSDDRFIFPIDYTLNVIFSQFISNLTLNKTLIYCSLFGILATALWVFCVGQYLDKYHLSVLLPEIINEISISYIVYQVFLPTIITFYLIFFISYIAGQISRPKLQEK